MAAASSEHALPPPLRSDGGIEVYVNPAWREAVDAAELADLPRILGRLPGSSSRLRGRATLWQWEPRWLPGRGLVVRQCAHGGLLGPLLGTRFLGRRRMLDEFRVALHAASHGVPTAAPVALRIARAPGPLVRAHYVTERIPDARNLLELAEGTDGRPAPAVRARLAAAVADAVAAMHDAGIVHADLNLKNVLVRGAFDRPECFIVDFDRAALRSEVPLGERMGNLLRLDRSVLKWRASRRLVGKADRLRLLRSYLARYPAWGPRWREIGRQYSSGHLRHRLSRERG